MPGSLLRNLRISRPSQTKRKVTAKPGFPDVEDSAGKKGPSKVFLEFMKELGDTEVRNVNENGRKEKVKLKSIDTETPEGKALVHKLFEQWLQKREQNKKYETPKSEEPEVEEKHKEEPVSSDEEKKQEPEAEKQEEPSKEPAKEPEEALKDEAKQEEKPAEEPSEEPAEEPEETEQDNPEESEVPENVSDEDDTDKEQQDTLDSLRKDVGDQVDIEDLKDSQPEKPKPVGTQEEKPKSMKEHLSELEPEDFDQLIEDLESVNEQMSGAKDDVRVPPSLLEGLGLPKGAFSTFGDLRKFLKQKALHRQDVGKKEESQQEATDSKTPDAKTRDVAEPAKPSKKESDHTKVADAASKKGADILQSDASPEAKAKAMRKELLKVEEQQSKLMDEMSSKLDDDDRENLEHVRDSFRRAMEDFPDKAQEQAKNLYDAMQVLFSGDESFDKLESTRTALLHHIDKCKAGKCEKKFELKQEDPELSKDEAEKAVNKFVSDNGGTGEAQGEKVGWLAAFLLSMFRGIGGVFKKLFRRNVDEKTTMNDQEKPTDKTERTLASVECSPCERVAHFVEMVDGFERNGKSVAADATRRALVKYVISTLETNDTLVEHKEVTPAWVQSDGPEQLVKLYQACRATRGGRLYCARVAAETFLRAYPEHPFADQIELRAQYVTVDAQQDGVVETMRDRYPRGLKLAETEIVTASYETHAIVNGRLYTADTIEKREGSNAASVETAMSQAIAELVDMSDNPLAVRALDRLVAEARMEEDNESVILWLSLPEDLEQEVRKAQETVASEAEKAGIEVTTKSPSSIEPHITLLYIGKCSRENMGKLKTAIRQVTSSMKPGELKLGKVSYFEGDASVCKFEVVGDWLDELHWRCRLALEDAGIPYEHSFPKYAPHVTLQYLEKDGKLDEDVIEVPDRGWTPKALQLSSGAGTEKLNFGEEPKEGVKTAFAIKKLGTEVFKRQDFRDVDHNEVVLMRRDSGLCLVECPYCTWCTTTYLKAIKHKAQKGSSPFVCNGCGRYFEVPNGSKLIRLKTIKDDEGILRDPLLLKYNQKVTLPEGALYETDDRLRTFLRKRFQVISHTAGSLHTGSARRPEDDCPKCGGHVSDRRWFVACTEKDCGWEGIDNWGTTKEERKLGIRLSEKQQALRAPNSIPQVFLTRQEVYTYLAEAKYPNWYRWGFTEAHQQYHDDCDKRLQEVMQFRKQLGVTGSNQPDWTDDDFYEAFVELADGIGIGNKKRPSKQDWKRVYKRYRPNSSAPKKWQCCTKPIKERDRRHKTIWVSNCRYKTTSGTRIMKRIVGRDEQGPRKIMINDKRIPFCGGGMS